MRRNVGKERKGSCLSEREKERTSQGEQDGIAVCTYVVTYKDDDRWWTAWFTVGFSAYENKII